MRTARVILPVVDLHSGSSSCSPHSLLNTFLLRSVLKCIILACTDAGENKGTIFDFEMCSLEGLSVEIQLVCYLHCAHPLIVIIYQY